MKIFEYTNPDFGKAFKRISVAMQTHFPDVEWVTENPDVEIVQVVGKKEYDYLMSKQSLSNVIMFQQCLYTTDIPVTNWAQLWNECKLTISFHNLNSYIDNKDKFFRTPLGAEPDLFPVSKSQRTYTVFSTGHVAETECLDKVFAACILANKKMLHTGENFKWDNTHYQFLEYMTDSWYSSILQRVKYVTGLRVIEGFEMACIEAAMTGAVPIVPFIQTYIDYKDFCIYIDMDKDITQQLVNIFMSEYKPLSLEQITYVRNNFSWQKICGEIYKRL